MNSLFEKPQIKLDPKLKDSLKQEDPRKNLERLFQDSSQQEDPRIMLERLFNAVPGSIFGQPLDNSGNPTSSRRTSATNGSDHEDDTDRKKDNQ